MYVSKRYEIEACAGQDECHARVLYHRDSGSELGVVAATDKKVLAIVPARFESEDSDTADEVDPRIFVAARAAVEENVADLRVLLGAQFAATVDGLCYRRPIPGPGRGYTLESMRALVRSAVKRATRRVAVDLELLARAARAIGTTKVRLLVGGDTDAVVVEPAEQLGRLDQQAPVALVMPIKLDEPCADDPTAACSAAVTALLDRVARDPDLRYVLDIESDEFKALCRAEAEHMGIDPDERIAYRREMTGTAVSWITVLRDAVEHMDERRKMRREGK